VTARIVLTGALPMTVTGLVRSGRSTPHIPAGLDTATSVCAGEQHLGPGPSYDHGFTIRATLGSGQGYAPGSQIEITIGSSFAIDGATYNGPGTYSIDWSSVPGSEPELNAVEIQSAEGDPIADMWKGTVTVSADERSATFSGIYDAVRVTPRGSGLVDSGTIEGTVRCVT
jgi:hypothetical protein